MTVELIGNSPAALTAGILLLTRARSLGIPGLRVEIVGDPKDITEVLGPAVLHSTVLASCGIGRELGQGALVVVPGPSTEPLLTCLAAEGLGTWFAIDSLGRGLHPATQAFVRLSRDRRPAASRLGRQLRRFMARVGLPPEPALFDFLFQPDEPALSRLALALRAGRAIAGDPVERLGRHLSAHLGSLPDPLPQGVAGEEVLRRLEAGELEDLLACLTVRSRDAVVDWLGAFGELAAEDGGRDLPLLGALAELASHWLLLPQNAMLPPPRAAADAVAHGLGRALGATRGQRDAARCLVEVYGFLGGGFVAEARHPIPLCGDPAPEGRMERWQWFARGVESASSTADALWRQVIDRPS